VQQWVSALTGFIGAVRNKPRIGVNAQKVEWSWAWSIRGSVWSECGCIFGAMQGKRELLALGDNCRAGAQKIKEH
jgi:hypothetical protein